MVNAETSSVIATLTFNGMIGATLMLIFEFFRRHQLDIYSPRIRQAGGECIPNPGNYPFSWIRIVWQVSDDDIIQIAGMDGYVYLRYLKTCFRITLVCAVFGIGVLCPIYATSDLNSDDDAVEGITLFSMANIPQKSQKLWAPLIFVYLFTAIFLFLMHKEYENFARARMVYFKGGDSKFPIQLAYSVQVENIPLEYRTSPRLRELFDSIFDNEVVCSYVATTLTPLENTIVERKSLLANLESYIAEYEASDLMVRPKLNLLNGIIVPAGGDEQVDAIDYLYDQISILGEEIYVLQLEAKMVSEGPENIEARNRDNKLIEDEIDAMRSSISGEGITLKRFSTSIKNVDKTISNFISTYKNKITARMVSGTGFITFRTRRTQAIAAQLPALCGEYPSMKVVPAPAPSDIVWNNMSASTDHTDSVSFLTSMMYYGGLLFWSAILAFIAAISNLSNLETYLPLLKHLNQSSYAILQGILPVLVMILFLTLLPMLMSFVSQNIERRKTFSKIQQEVFKWYFMYQLANVYLILLTGSAFSSLSDVIDNPTSILKYISAALPASSVFFINFIITQVFGGIPLIYLRIVPLLYLQYIRYSSNERKLTRRALVEGPLADSSVEYGTTLPDALYVLCISLLYWVISPSILIVALLFFGGCYLAWKYQYLYVLVRKYESGGMYWYGLYKYSMMGLLASTITMMTYMSIKEAVTQAPLLLPLPFFIIFTWQYTEGKFKALSENVPFSLAVTEDKRGGHVQKENIKFSEDFLKPPSMLAPKSVFPYPYRIGGAPLLDSNGLVNSVYLEELPDGVFIADRSQQYVPPVFNNAKSGSCSPLLQNQML